MPHCLTCGTNHDGEFCSPKAFILLKCKCGNESLIPGDVLMMGLKGMFCGQCNKDTDWTITQATLEDLKKHWKGYGEKNEPSF